MSQSLTRIYLYILLSVFQTNCMLRSQTKSFTKQEIGIMNEKSSLDESRNRFPEILHDVKILLSEVNCLRAIKELSQKNYSYVYKKTTESDIVCFNVILLHRLIEVTSN